ncbi:urate oxidase [Micromonospora sp. KC207]|uniref:Uricase n=1 Tax=Micromonospora carbonacea TaxID=47853 RepID=A0A7D6CG75_9ACTN|nr:MULTISPECIES: urate oxidase [unclassified Micromonospora]EEP74992.1 urate oxidase [Micromonospora sp. ATCC 39149]QLK00734.1 urate oxidase [Micromonospora carbonacea]TDC51166.1 urate oxidase [Micromonospora sp. KC207]
MGIVLGPNRYGKAEVRVVHVARDGDRHTLRDLDVRTALAGDLDATHLTGDNSQVLPTDSQKNTVYAFAREHGVASPEAFALLLARHFVHSQAAVRHARVAVQEFGWQRLGPHSFQRDGAQTRTATVSYDGDTAQVVSGLTGLVLMNTTNSEFHGYVRDEYTTLPETTDRILATAVDARWRHLDAGADWDAAYQRVREALVAAFVETYSRSLQQTLYAMGRRVLQTRPELAEIKLSLPNRHHIPVDLSPFGLDNPNAVFVATDRPYGVIEGTVGRDDVAPAGGDW